jgi:hypothetical protein
MRSRNVRHHALQARCEQHLRGIEIPQPFSLDVFAASVAARRGRALRVLPLPGLDGADCLSGDVPAARQNSPLVEKADAQQAKNR